MIRNVVGGIAMIYGENLRLRAIEREYIPTFLGWVQLALSKLDVLVLRLQDVGRVRSRRLQDGLLKEEGLVFGARMQGGASSSPRLSNRWPTSGSIRSLLGVGQETVEGSQELVADGYPV